MVEYYSQNVAVAATFAIADVVVTKVCWYDEHKW
jgi:hypothetical protein